MALTAAGFGMSVSFLDNGSNVVSREYTMDPAVVTTYAEAEAAALDILPDVVAVTDAALPEYRVFQVFRETALAIPGSGIQVENQASLTLLLTSPGNEKANLNIPAAKPALFVQTSGPQANIVNMGNAAILALIGNFFDGENFTISDGEKVARGLNGKRVHKKSTRG